MAQTFKSEDKTLLNVNSNKKVTKKYLTAMKGQRLNVLKYSQLPTQTTTSSKRLNLLMAPHTLSQTTRFFLSCFKENPNMDNSSKSS